MIIGIVQRILFMIDGWMIMIYLFLIDRSYVIALFIINNKREIIRYSKCISNWRIMWMVKTDQIFAIHSTNQSIQQSFCSYYYYFDIRKMTLYDIQHSYVFCICYLWSIDWVLCQYWRIQHSIQISKCEWTIDNTNYYNHHESNTFDLNQWWSNW